MEESLTGILSLQTPELSRKTGSEESAMYFELPATPPEQINPAVLAYLGDAVYELLTREFLLHRQQEHSRKLHNKALLLCSAVGQAKAMRALLPPLDAEEQHQFKRGRNAALSVTKRDNPTVHCAASGLETLFGYLYLKKEQERMLQLFSICVQTCLPEEEIAKAE